MCHCPRGGTTFLPSDSQLQKSKDLCHQLSIVNKTTYLFSLSPLLCCVSCWAYGGGVGVKDDQNPRGQEVRNGPFCASSLWSRLEVHSQDWGAVWGVLLGNSFLDGSSVCFL